MNTSNEVAAEAEQSRIRVRQAMPADARRIFEIVEPYARDEVLITKALITYFESIQEFLVAGIQSDSGEWGNRRLRRSARAVGRHRRDSYPRGCP